jgi:hypothetical protein
MGEMKFPEMKIGDAAMSTKPVETAAKPGMIVVPPASPPPPPPLKKSPLPPIKKNPPLNPYKDFRRG